MTFPNSQSNPKGAVPVYLCANPYGGQIIQNLTANGGVLVKTGPGTLDSVVVGIAGSGSSLTIYDGTSASGTLLGTVSTVVQNALALGWSFQTGLFVNAAGGSAANVTIVAH